MKSWVRTVRWTALALAALAGVLAVAIALVYQAELRRPVGSARPFTVAGDPAVDARLARSGEYLQVRAGSSFGAVLADLRRLGWISRPRVARWEARRRGWDRRVVPGWYRRQEGETVGELLARLARGEVEQTKVTIPEGWRLPRILATLADSAWVPLEQFRRVAADESWLAAQAVPGPGLEGYLLPETYRIPRGEEPRRILEQLVRPGRTYWVDSLETAAGAVGLDRRQVWTLASIIEAEAASAAERERISAVFHNRLRLGMRLESDPTVLFALGRRPGRVLYADLEVDSPYNTYRRSGLPPGPICSPGRASLRAAVHPEPGCDALFFVARGDGTHVFSRTLAEHNWNRRVLRSGG